MSRSNSQAAAQVVQVRIDQLLDERRQLLADVASRDPAIRRALRLTEIECEVERLWCQRQVVNACVRSARHGHETWGEVDMSALH